MFLVVMVCVCVSVCVCVCVCVCVLLMVLSFWYITRFFSANIHYLSETGNIHIS